MIEIAGLGHSYGRKRVLDGVDLTVPAGCVMGLVGPNSAGKTTLMSAVVALLAPSAGSVKVAGHDTRRDERAVRQAVGYLPERTSLYPELLVWEYLDFFAELAGHDASARRRRVDEALARTGLGDRRELPTRALSKGMRQRLALAGALMHDPMALVLDEPTDGLDPMSRDLFLAEVKGLAEGGAAVLLSSHVLAEVEAVADQVTILVGGRVIDERADELPRFSFRLRGDLARARALLATAPGVAAAAIDGELLIVDLEAGVPDASGLAAALVGAGFALVELREERDTLRRRFLRAVDRGQEGVPS